MITANIKFEKDFQIVELLSSESSYGPEAIEEALKAVATLQVDNQKGVVLSHRGAIWLHSALAHHFHPSLWVAHFDPRLGGAVVVQSHARGVEIGSIVPV